RRRRRAGRRDLPRPRRPRLRGVAAPARQARRTRGRDCRTAGPLARDLLADLQAGVIAHLRGRIFDKHPNRIVVDVNGVGYEVFVPLSTFYGLGDPGADLSLRIHTHVREDAFTLYGFATLLEQELFERLIGVSGIGPKVALAVLSGIEPHEL